MPPEPDLIVGPQQDGKLTRSGSTDPSPTGRAHVGNCHREAGGDRGRAADRLPHRRGGGEDHRADPAAVTLHQRKAKVVLSCRVTTETGLRSAVPLPTAPT